MDFDLQWLSAVPRFVEDHWAWFAAVLGPAGLGAVFAFLRRPRRARRLKPAYFTDGSLLEPPLTRPAYSDRMAYVLAELSDIAYGGRSGLVHEIAAGITDLLRHGEGKASATDAASETRHELLALLEKFQNDLLAGPGLGRDMLDKLLAEYDFELLAEIDEPKTGTQGFACKRVAPNEPHYVVVAFRGTEKRASDWMTDIDATPNIEQDDARVMRIHRGFLRAFEAVREDLEAIMSSDAVKDEEGVALPIFFTGHSLGGALALLATRHLADDVNGACYTFGAPRVGNYEYFRNVKTPVYRIVNSSDIVPRVPPGALITITLLLLKLLSWATTLLPRIQRTIERAEAFLDKFHGYRHFGDLRYLTDVAAGRFGDVELLANPPAMDRLLWAYQHVAATFYFPVSSHSVTLYRKKLLEIAKRRNVPDS